MIVSKGKIELNEFVRDFGDLTYLIGQIGDEIIEIQKEKDDLEEKYNKLLEYVSELQTILDKENIEYEYLNFS